MTARRVVDGEEGRAEAIAVLRAGGIVAVPTDTVYGLAVAMATPGGIDRLFEAKRRPSDRAIAVLLADAAQAEEIGILSESARELGAAFWPGGLTLVLAQRPDRQLPPGLTAGRSTIGVRVPDHPAPRALAAALGPLPTTSANLSGEAEARDAAEIARLFADCIHLILDGGRSAGGPPSTVVDVSSEEARVLREGAIPSSVIQASIRRESVGRDMGR